MPNLVPGATKIPLTDRISAAWQALRGQPSNIASFGPATPIAPSPITPAAAPRQFEYPPAVNLSLLPRGEYPKLSLTPFQQLRQLARFYSVAAICIETRINWMCTAKWSVVASNKREQQTRQSECDAVAAFFKKPDRVTPFPAWLRTIMLDMLEIDALTIYRQRDRLGRLLSLDYINGETIKPLLDIRGKTTAYQQILYGYVRGEYTQDGMPAPDPWPVGGDLTYMPRWTSTDSPYGHPPTEAIILLVNMAIRKQTMDLSHFTDGNIPAGFWSPPEGVPMQPEQVRQFEDAFNADLAGLDRERNRIKFMPWDGKYTPTAPFSYTREIDEWLKWETCGAFHIPPAELGDTKNVNKSVGEAQENVAYRHAVLPDAEWLKNVIFDPIICDDLGYRGLEWAWNFGETEDIAKIATVQQGDVKAGIISADESRRLRYPDLDGKAPTPPAPAAPAPIAQLAKAATHTGAMVALMVPRAVAKRLVHMIDPLVDGDTEPAEDLHITLAYLGDTRDADVGGNYFHCKQAIGEVASRMPPIEGVLNGIGRFHAVEGAGVHALWVAFDAPELPKWRQELIEALQAFSVPVDDDHGFTPHITLAYIPKDAETPNVRLPNSPIMIDTLTLAWGDDRQEWPLLGKRVQKAETVTTATGLVADDRAPRRKRRRRKRAAPTLDQAVITQAQELYRQVRG
jgi:2'-5' RNA ligase